MSRRHPLIAPSFPCEGVRSEYVGAAPQGPAAASADAVRGRIQSIDRKKARPGLSDGTGRSVLDAKRVLLPYGVSTARACRLRGDSESETDTAIPILVQLRRQHAIDARLARYHMGLRREVEPSGRDDLLYPPVQLVQAVLNHRVQVR